MIFMSFYVLSCIVFVATLVKDIAQHLTEWEQTMLRDAMANKLCRINEDKPATGEKNFWLRCRLFHLLASVMIFFSLVFAGAIFYSTYESCSCSYGDTKEENYPNCVEGRNCSQEGSTLNFKKAFYMSIFTLTTVGFGDFAPLSRIGRTVGIVWMLLGAMA